MANLILVVDMVRGFHDIGNLKNPRTAKIIRPIHDLLERKMRQGWNLIFVRDMHVKHDKEFEMFPEHCVFGTREIEIVRGLAGFTKACAATIISKSTYSSFNGTALEAILFSAAPKEVIVVGVCTDICVLYAVADLRNRGYMVTVPRDCVETYDGSDHPADEENFWALRHMQKVLGAKVIPAAREL